MTAFAALSVLLTNTLRAETIESHLLSVTPVGSNFRYDYELVLTNGNGLSSSGFESGLIILDFQGLVGTPVLSSSGTDITVVGDWSAVATPATGGAPLSNTTFAAGVTTMFGTNPFNFAGGLDSAAIPNIVLQYAGSDIAVDLANPRDLIHLSAVSVYGTHAVTTVTVSRDTGPSADRRPTENYSIDAPVPAVPLPAAAWAGFALFGGLGLKKLRRNGQAVTA
jgi:hypothetical protein